MSYIELHTHSAYSFLDGASRPEELVVRAAELGYPALALTDHDGVSGSLEFAHAAKAFGVRPITGAEVTLKSSVQNDHDVDGVRWVVGGKDAASPSYPEVYGGDRGRRPRAAQRAPAARARSESSSCQTAGSGSRR